MSMTVQRREELQTEIQSFMDLYNEAFVSGTREDLQALVHLPVIYVSETETQIPLIHLLSAILNFVPRLKHKPN